MAANAAAQSLPGSLQSCRTRCWASSSSLGVTQDQAEGDVGSILTLAQEKLAKGGFRQDCPDSRSQRLREKAKTLGAVTGPLLNGAGLNGALGKLRIDAATAAKFIPQVTSS